MALSSWSLLSVVQPCVILGRQCRVSNLKSIHAQREYSNFTTHNSLHDELGGSSHLFFFMPTKTVYFKSSQKSR